MCAINTILASSNWDWFSWVWLTQLTHLIQLIAGSPRTEADLRRLSHLNQPLWTELLSLESITAELFPIESTTERLLPLEPATAELLPLEPTTAELLPSDPATAGLFPSESTIVAGVNRCTWTNHRNLDPPSRQEYGGYGEIAVVVAGQHNQDRFGTRRMGGSISIQLCQNHREWISH